MSTTANFALAPDGVRIAYETHGEGSPALVFVHGWSCDRSYWNGQIEAFSRRCKVVAIDLAGHGESGLARQDWSIRAFGSDVAAVVNALGVQRVVLIGHSMGGDVIVEAARGLAGRVAALVWVDTYDALGAPRSDEQIEAILAPLRADSAQVTREWVRGMFAKTSDASLVERVAADMASAPPAIAIAAAAASFAFDREVPGALRELQLPVIAINADHRPTDVASLARCGIEAIVMPRCGHFLMMEDPARFNAILGGVVDRYCARQASRSL